MISIFEKALKDNHFLFYTPFYEIMNMLSDEEALQYIRAICEYVINGTPIEKTGNTKVDISLVAMRDILEVERKLYLKNEARKEVE